MGGLCPAFPRLPTLPTKVTDLRKKGLQAGLHSSKYNPRVQAQKYLNVLLSLAASGRASAPQRASLIPHFQHHRHKQFFLPGLIPVQLLSQYSTPSSPILARSITDGLRKQVFHWCGSLHQPEAYSYTRVL